MVDHNPENVSFAHDLNGISLRDRLVKEAVHELGHTFGLRHCADWRCVMSSSYGVERLDVKGADFCPRCRKPVFDEHLW
jgi:predicted Zn-dependent protease